jgi:sugar transferase EpsL
MPRSPAKRAIDIAGAVFLLLLAAPLMLAIAVLIRCRMGRPVCFRQLRAGLGGRPFGLLKFRTMTDQRDPNGELLSDAERLTPLGRFLRRLSLDELPQLWNVLRGEMSLVGPRPLLLEYLDRYTSQQARRHEVQPGITGWAQVNGRQGLPFSRRLEMDVWYVDHQGFALDARIALLTLKQVFTAHGVKLGQEVAEVDDIGLSRAARTTPADA